MLESSGASSAQGGAAGAVSGAQGASSQAAGGSTSGGQSQPQSTAHLPAHWQEDGGAEAKARQGAQTEAEIKKWKIKAEGREHEFTEDELVTHAQKGISAEKRWQEAARKAQESQATLDYLLTEIRRDPVAFLSRQEIGIDPELMKTSTSRFLSDDLERSLDPEGYQARKQQEDQQRELDEYRSEKKQREEEKLKNEDSEYQRGWDKRVREAFAGSETVPLSNYTYNTAINYIDQALRQGYKDVTMNDVMPLVERDWQQSHADIFKLPDDKLLKMIGDDNLQRIQKLVLSRVIKPRGKPGQQPSHVRDEPKKMTTWADNERNALERMRADGII